MWFQILKIIFALYSFMIGAAAGSFLEVLLNRAQKGENWITKRSYCDKCQKPLSPLELIPIFSFLYLKGKCSKCSSKISWKYPVGEMLAGITFLLSFLFPPLFLPLFLLLYFLFFRLYKIKGGFSLYLKTFLVALLFSGALFFLLFLTLTVLAPSYGPS